jgi:hypothetical protein
MLHLQLLQQRQLMHLQSVQTLELVTVQLLLANQLQRLKVHKNHLASVQPAVNSMVSVQSVLKETIVRDKTATVIATATEMVETIDSVTVGHVETTSAMKLIPRSLQTMY